jgi:hypothetical protein
MAVMVASADLLISIEYNDAPTDDGAEIALGWAILHDNPVLGWGIDETGATPPVPIILGSMPPAAPATDPIASPLWAVRDKGTLYIPDMARGSANELFNFVATNNGATRKLYADFADTNMATAWNEWCRVNPTLFYETPPNIAPEDVEGESTRMGGMDDRRPLEIRRAETEKRRADEEARREDQRREAEARGEQPAAA